MQPNLPNKVFLLNGDKNKTPLNPISPSQARNLLKKGKAAVFRQFPFTLILKKEVENPTIFPLTLKIDPGSKFTGLAILSGDTVVWVSQIEHRGSIIKARMSDRAASRRSRRNRKTRYRPARFNNRKRAKGWLAPSLMHRVFNVETWTKRLVKFSPLTEIWIERVKFDIQKMENAEISGVEYQQGTLTGYDVREYLLEKWGRKCVYCGKEHVPFEIEHIHPRSKGGSDRVSNLTISCHKCNQKKGDKLPEVFLKNKPEVLEKVLSQAKKPLKDAAAVNSTRNKIVEVLSELLPVKTATGSQTKQNRMRLNLPKDHHIDAACVGDVETLKFEATQPLMIKSAGHGSRQYQLMNKYGFPRTQPKEKENIYFGFQTGDLVVANVTEGKKKGVHKGRVAVRKTGNFNIQTNQEIPGKKKNKKTVEGVSHEYCKKIHGSDGYNYSFKKSDGE